MTRPYTRRDTSAPEEELSPRRRRDDTEIAGRRLGVNTSLLEFDRFEYRYINDSNVRLFHMTNRDDWEIVTQEGGSLKPDATDLGNAVSVVVGSKPDGSALRTFLCRKPKRYFEEDRQKKQTELDEQLAQLRKGNSKAGEPQGDYVPNGGIQIARS